MDENKLHQLARVMLDDQGKNEWTFAILDEHPTLEQCAGFTRFDVLQVELYRELWPTQECNAVEVVRHEIAHAVLGHGRHDREWWAKLIKLGGTGTWVNDDGNIASWSWTLEKIERS